MKQLTFNDVRKANEAADLIRQLGSNSNVTLELRGASVCFPGTQPSAVLLLLLKSRYGFDFSEADVDALKGSSPKQKGRRRWWRLLFWPYGGGRQRIVSGATLIFLFLIGLGGNPPSMAAYLAGGSLLLVVPGGLLMWSGWRARKKP